MLISSLLGEELVDGVVITAVPVLLGGSGTVRLFSGGLLADQRMALEGTERSPDPGMAGLRAGSPFNGLSIPVCCPTPGQCLEIKGIMREIWCLV
mmetsp:Transcript_5997/g.13821  ORF Transcript_5997/g.13821 Transcript_5997/m.13821 type:complete len:95 (+) Transcript_5997:729-1013(+)